MWLTFFVAIIALLLFDLGVLHREGREIGVKESLALSAGYIAAGLAFGGGVWWYLGPESGMAYLAGFTIEKTLAMDNVFVIATIFSFFAVPRRYQHKVLFWGIVGVILMRALLIGLGAALVSQFSWMLYVFGAFLVITGIRMLVFAKQSVDLASNPLLKWLRRHLRVTNEFHGNRFWVKLPAPDTGREADTVTRRPGAPLVWWATPLFLALVLIEMIDVVFAVDSVPAIFAITQDPFVVYTSNIFAILGLRALYFALAAMIARFQYLKHALALVLMFIGGKIFAVEWVGKTPVWISLSVTIGLIAAGVVYSLYRTRHGPKAVLQESRS
jgi:tellurite resistance protein TerC